MGSAQTSPSELTLEQQASKLWKQVINFIFQFQSFFGLVIVFVLAVVYSPVRNDTNIFLSQRNLTNVTGTYPKPVF